MASSSGSSSTQPPQLQLNIPESNSSTTSFKRSFQQLGLDLEEGTAGTSSPKRPRGSIASQTDSPPQLPLINVDVHMGSEEEDHPISIGQVPMLPPLSIHRSVDHSLPSPSVWNHSMTTTAASGPPQLPLPVTSSLEHLFSDVEMPFASSSSARQRTASTSSRPRIDLDLAGASGSLYQEMFASSTESSWPSLPLSSPPFTGTTPTDLRPLNVALPLHRRPAPQLSPLTLDLDTDTPVSSSAPNAGSWRRRPPRLPSLHFDQDRASFDSATTASSTRPERFIPRIPSPEPTRRLSLDFDSQPSRRFLADSDDSEIEELDFREYTEQLRRNRQARRPPSPPPARSGVPPPIRSYLPNLHSSNLVDEYTEELGRMRDREELHSFLTRRTSSSSIDNSFLSEHPSSLALGAGDIERRRRFRYSRDNPVEPLIGTSRSTQAPRLREDFLRQREESLRLQNHRNEEIMRTEEMRRERQQRLRANAARSARAHQLMSSMDTPTPDWTSILDSTGRAARERIDTYERTREAALSPAAAGAAQGDRMRARFARLSAQRRRIARAGSLSLAFGDYVRDEDFDESYEGLLELTRRIGDVKPKGTPEQIMNKLEVVLFKNVKKIKLSPTAIESASAKVKGKQKEEDKERCFICLDDYEDTDEILRIPECTHYSHRACLEQWFRDATTCPVCRYDIAPPQYPRTIASSGLPYIPDFTDFQSNAASTGEDNSDRLLPFLLNRSRRAALASNNREHQRVPSRVEDILNHEEDFGEGMSRLLSRISEARDRLRSPLESPTADFRESFATNLTEAQERRQSRASISDPFDDYTRFGNRNLEARTSRTTFAEGRARYHHRNLSEMSVSFSDVIDRRNNERYGGRSPGTSGSNSGSASDNGRRRETDPQSLTFRPARVDTWDFDGLGSGTFEDSLPSRRTYSRRARSPAPTILPGPAYQAQARPTLPILHPRLGSRPEEPSTAYQPRLASHLPRYTHPDSAPASAQNSMRTMYSYLSAQAQTELDPEMEFYSLLNDDL